MVAGSSFFLQGANFFHHTRNIICTLCVNAGDAMQDGVQNIFWVDTMIRKVQQTPAPHIHSHLEVFSHRNTESLPLPHFIRILSPQCIWAQMQYPIYINNVDDWWFIVWLEGKMWGRLYIFHDNLVNWLICWNFNVWT